MDLSKEIDEIIGGIAEEAKVETPAEEPKAEEPAEPTPPEEPAEAKEPAEEVKGEEEEVVKEPPKAEPQEEEPEEDRASVMQATINRMAEALLRAGVVYDPQTGEVKPPTPPVAPTPPPQEEVEVDLSKFKIIPENVDFDDVVGSREAFENFFRDVLNRYEQVRIRRDALIAPAMVSNQVQRVFALKNAVDSFYQQNEDLVSVKPLVGAYANQIVAAHPDWTLPQVLDEAAKVTRQAVGIKVGQKSEEAKKPQPSFAKPSGVRPAKQAAKPDKLRQEIDELISDF